MDKEKDSKRLGPDIWGFLTYIARILYEEEPELYETRSEEFRKEIVKTMATATTKPAENKTEMTAKDVTVIREGTKIILPEDMTYDEGILWLQRKREEDEKVIAIHYHFNYSPLDGAVAFHKALADIYGWAELVPTPGFFSSPPVMIGVPISVNETMQVPWGAVQIPSIAGTLETSYSFNPPRFVINGSTKQKHKQEIQKIAEKTEDNLKKHSIYKNKAIKISYEWERQGARFNPTAHCPKFISLEGVKEDGLIFGKEVQSALDIGLFTPIEHAEACRKYQVPLKRGILLYGKYGTGKTLTASVTALKAIRNNFTFIYLESVLDLKPGLQFAAQYAPCVVFSEDIDRVLQGERSLNMDEILNILDGVDTKGGEIVSVFTTNNIESINPALLRMGRLDTLVEVKPPDAEAAIKLVKLYSRNLLAESTNFEKIGKALAGRIPAFIREVTERAKIAAIARVGGADIKGKVKEEDLLGAADAMKNHADLLEDRKPKEEYPCDLMLRIPRNHEKLSNVLATLGNNFSDE